MSTNDGSLSFIGQGASIGREAARFSAAYFHELVAEKMDPQDALQLTIDAQRAAIQALVQVFSIATSALPALGGMIAPEQEQPQ